jgi:predicted secreted protein
MKKFFWGLFFVLLLIFITLPTYAANIQIQVDGIDIASDTAPEITNNCTMVPVRVISEILGANVSWSHSEVTISKSNMEVKLKLDDGTALINGETMPLDAKPYIKNNRTMVPLRFLAEMFGCNVDYKDLIVIINTEPLVIDGVKVKTLQYEYRMTMGGVVHQITGNAYNEAIYNIFLENKGSEVEAPISYSWHINLDTPGAFYKNGQYDFLDLDGNSIKCFDIYTLIRSFPEEILVEYPRALIYDANADKWCLFDDTAIQSIGQLIETARENGFLKVISNTVV